MSTEPRGAIDGIAFAGGRVGAAFARGMAGAEFTGGRVGARSAGGAELTGEIGAIGGIEPAVAIELAGMAADGWWPEGGTGRGMTGATVPSIVLPFVSWLIGFLTNRGEPPRRSCEH